MDDGSTDNSREVISEYVSKDSRIQYHWQQNSGTPAKPKNTAFQYVKGQYVAYLDQDDEWLPEKLEKQLAVFEKHPNEKIGLVGCDAYVVNENGLLLTMSPAIMPDFVLSDLLVYNYVFSNSSALLPTVVVKEIGDRDESVGIDYAEDWDMWIRVMVGEYTLRFIEEPLLNYTIHSHNVSGATSKLKQAEMSLAFYNKHKELYKNNDIEHIFLNRIGLSYCLAGKTRIAREYYKKAIRIKKTYVAPYLGMVLTYLWVGATVFALRFWNTLFRDENLQEPANRLRQAEARLVFHRAHKNLYEYSNTEHIFLKTIGLHYALAGDGKKAREYYKKSIDIKKTYVAPYIGIALTYMGVGVTEIMSRIWVYIKNTTVS